MFFQVCNLLAAKIFKKKKIMLQYITNTDCGRTVQEQVKAVLEGGCRWIQVRMKEASDEEIEKVIEDIKPMCLEVEAFLILDDRVELAKKTDVGGVHLGKTDMAPSRARMILGPAAVIGCTANTIDDIKAVRALDVDYIGIGPFRETNTKKNLSPILGLDGIRNICFESEKDEISIPRVAVGGIKLDDVLPLLEAGVNGVAVSGAIAFADDMVEATKKFVSLMPVKE